MYSLSVSPQSEAILIRDGSGKVIVATRLYTIQIPSPGIEKLLAIPENKAQLAELQRFVDFANKGIIQFYERETE